MIRIANGEEVKDDFDKIEDEKEGTEENIGTEGSNDTTPDSEESNSDTTNDETDSESIE